MKSGTPVSVKIVNWEQDEATLRTLRETVFVLEQHVPVELEWDGLDPACVHVLAYVKEGIPVGTARRCCGRGAASESVPACSGH
jgi:predicted GNAT family N-acyltransferase